MRRCLFIAGLLPLLLLVSLAFPPIAHASKAGGGIARRMGRIKTVGWEIGIGNTLSAEDLEGLMSGNILPVIDTTFKRSGNSSAKCVSVNNDSSSVGYNFASASEVYIRAYYNFSGLPTAQCSIFALTDVAFNSTCEVLLNTNGTLQLFNDVTSLNVGSPSAALVPGTWYRVEIHIKVSTTVGTLECRLDGTTFASSTGIKTSVAGDNVNSLGFGWEGITAGVNKTVWIDDSAVNNTAGTAQNSWPGAGSEVLLKPISDNARTGWVNGGAGTTNLWQGVANTPPVGVSDFSETATSQIHDIVSSATDNYDANVTSYSSAGIQAGDTITLVQAVCDTSEALAGVKNGALKIVSNPAQSVEDSFVFGSNLGTASTWSTNWEGFWGTPQYAPTVTLATSPVLRIGKRTATTAEVMCDFMGIYVEYVPGSVATTQPHRLALLGVGL